MSAPVQRAIRIFISSPSELSVEREVCKQVITELGIKLRKRAVLSDYFYEEKPMNAGAGFQRQIENPADFDIVVGMLWNRLGSPLQEKEIPDWAGDLDETLGVTIDRKALTGTTCEIFAAMAAHKRTGKTELLVYQKTADTKVNLEKDDIEKLKAEKQELLRFFDEHFKYPDGKIKRAWTPFTDEHHFRQLIEQHLREHISKLLDIRNLDRWILIERAKTGLLLILLAVTLLWLPWRLTAASREAKAKERQLREKTELIQKALALTSQASRGAGDVIAQLLVSRGEQLKADLPAAEQYFEKRVNRYAVGPDHGTLLLRANELANFAEFYIQLVHQSDLQKREISDSDRATFFNKAGDFAREAYRIRNGIHTNPVLTNTHSLHDVAASENQLGDIETRSRGLSDESARGYYEKSRRNAIALRAQAPGWQPADVLALASTVRLLSWNIAAYSAPGRTAEKQSIVSNIASLSISALDLFDAMIASAPEDAMLAEFAAIFLRENAGPLGFDYLFNESDDKDAVYYDTAIRIGRGIAALCNRYPAFENAGKIQTTVTNNTNRLIATRPK